MIKYMLTVLFITVVYTFSRHGVTACGGFLRRDNWDTSGNDLLSAPVQVSDYAGCCSRCQTTSECNAIVYSPSTRRCWVKTSVGNGGFASTDRITAFNPNTCGIFQRTDGWLFYGNDIASSPVQATSYGQCCGLCQATTGCRAFTYSPSRQLCWTKTGIGCDVRKDADRISGYNPSLYGGFVRRDGWNIYGNDIGSPYTGILNYFNCTSLCQKTTGCFAVGYSPSRQTCWLKNSLGFGGNATNDRITGYNRNKIIYTSGNYKLTVVDKDDGITSTTKQTCVNTFFATMPKMCDRFNPQSCKRDVQITFDPAFIFAPAAASGGAISINAQYLRDNPRDTDIVTHESMHVVQAYSIGDFSWLIEGIADYARWKYGINNAAAGWSLPNYSPSQKYTDSYRVTARFLAWCEKFYPKIVNQLDVALRNKTYTDNSWTLFAAGKSVNQLWTEYGRNPTL